MNKRITTNAYFKMPETMRPMELVYGVVREPPAPRYGHQSIVSRLDRLLGAHVAEHKSGDVCVSPVDVVLDREAALVLQPDVIFVSSDRLHIIGDRVWGAPDLVVEVLSPRTARRDRTTKLGWYRHYGVKECWLVDPKERRVDVVDLRTGTSESFSGKTPIVSHVLPEFAVAAEQCFE